MRKKSTLYYLAVLLMIIPAGLYASDFKINDVTLSSTSWGNQSATIKLSNISEDYKFITAVSEVRFGKGNAESSSFSKASFFVEPSAELDIQLPVTISPGFGEIEISIKLYDVVDTLDQLIESHKFFTKTFPAEFKISEKLKNEISDDLTFPKFVRNNGLFNNYFSRSLLTMMYRKKTIEEIADLYQVENKFIASILNDYVEAGFISMTGSSPKINFMVIDKKQAESIMPAINNTADKLYAVLVKNLQTYDETLVSMVSQGKLTADKHDALDMGAILYQKYPIMMGLFLWDILGREFVNDGLPFNIFEGSDLCNAVMGDYMFMTIGPGKFVGDSYYYLSGYPDNNVIFCGIGVPNITCPENFRELGHHHRPIRLGFDVNNPDKVFIYNEDRIREPLSLLMDGTTAIVENLKTDLADNFSGTYYDTNNRGTRYWCWDLVVTRLMAKLEENKIVELDKTRLYRLQKTEY